MVKLYNGDSFRLGDQRGRPVVLNFWASWCVPCRSEMPAFERTFRAYGKRGAVFVGIAVNDDPAAARAFLKELAITYPAGPDVGSAISQAYQVFGLPTSVLITPGGKVARKHTGEMTEQQLVDSLKLIVP